MALSTTLTPSGAQVAPLTAEQSASSDIKIRLNRKRVLDRLWQDFSNEIRREKGKSSQLTEALRENPLHRETDEEDAGREARDTDLSKGGVEQSLQQNLVSLHGIEDLRDFTPSKTADLGSLVVVQWLETDELEIFFLVKQKPNLRPDVYDAKIEAIVNGKKHELGLTCLTSSNGSALLFNRIVGKRPGDDAEDFESNRLRIIAIF